MQSKKVGAAIKSADRTGNYIHMAALFILSLLVLIIVFRLNRDFFERRVLQYWDDYKEQRVDMDLESRKTQRWGNGYFISKTIADWLAKKHFTHPITVLLPSTNYFTAAGIDYHVPEPAVFYYYTSLKTVWQDCGDVHKADFFVYAKNQHLYMDSVKNYAQLDSVLRLFKKFKTSL